MPGEEANSVDLAPKQPSTRINRDRCLQGKTNKLILPDHLSQMCIDIPRGKEKEVKRFDLSLLCHNPLYFSEINYMSHEIFMKWYLHVLQI